MDLQQRDGRVSGEVGLGSGFRTSPWICAGFCAGWCTSRVLRLAGVGHGEDLRTLPLRNVEDRLWKAPKQAAAHAMAWPQEIDTQADGTVFIPCESRVDIRFGERPDDQLRHYRVLPRIRARTSNQESPWPGFTSRSVSCVARSRSVPASGSRILRRRQFSSHVSVGNDAAFAGIEQSRLKVAQEIVLGQQSLVGCHVEEHRSAASVLGEHQRAAAFP